MSDDIWDARRLRALESKAKAAVMDLFAHTGGASSLVLPLDVSAPGLVLAAGEADRLARMLPVTASPVQQQNGEDARDAARYQWARENPQQFQKIAESWWCCDGTRYADEYRDHDIDAAMLLTKGGDDGITESDLIGGES